MQKSNPMGIKIIKAIKIKKESDINYFKNYNEADIILFDSSGFEKSLSWNFNWIKNINKNQINQAWINIFLGVVLIFMMFFYFNYIFGILAILTLIYLMYIQIKKGEIDNVEIDKNDYSMIISLMLGLVNSNSCSDFKVIPITLPPCLIAVSATIFIKPTLPPPNINSRPFSAISFPICSPAVL